MPSDLYSALIGAPVDSMEKQAMLADMLRRKAGMAQVAQMTGDPALAPMGQDQARQAQQQAAQLRQAQEAGQEAAFRQQQEQRIAANAQIGFDLERSGQALTRRGQDLGLTETLARIEAEKAKLANKPPTEGQSLTRGYLGRMQAAAKLMDEKYVPSTKDFVAASNVYGGEGALRASLANSVLSAEGRKYYQAAADWVRAKLRKESGAAIGEKEMAAEFRTYFPVPSDGPEEIAQKAAARAQAEAEMATMGGMEAPKAAPKVKRTGTLKDGRKVVEYEDGTIDYAN